MTACAEMLKEWSPQPAPKWVTCIPSRNHPALVPAFAEMVARTLELPFIQSLEVVGENRQQKEMANSYQQVKNLDGIFQVTALCQEGECLLIDDIVDSGWTLTVASALLRHAGCPAVFPVALALNRPRMI